MPVIYGRPCRIVFFGQHNLRNERRDALVVYGRKVMWYGRRARAGDSRFAQRAGISGNAEVAA